MFSILAARCYNDPFMNVTAAADRDMECALMTPDLGENDLLFMQQALALAEQAAAAGEVPVAALIVDRDRVIAQAFNRREMWQDPTAHAEMIVIREAATRLGTWRLTGLTLYVTLEPCTMCIGATLQSRLARVVFAAWDPKAGACGSLFDIPPDPRLNHSVQVIGGVAERESQALLQDFFRRLRTEADTSL